MNNLTTVKHTSSPYDNKPIYFQRAPFIPPKINTVNNAVFECIDPLEWVSLPDLFFGDSNYQNMLPSLDIPIPPENYAHSQALETSHGHPHQTILQNGPANISAQYPQRQLMQSFPPEKVNDFKHVIYNLLVENHNNPHKSNFIQPCTIEENNVVRTGFCFNENENPEKKLPELYAQHIRKARLEQEDISSVFVHDLYKFYLRASVELLSKYFEKRDKYTYLYEDTPLFVPNGTLEQAEERIRNMKTRARKKRKLLSS